MSWWGDRNNNHLKGLFTTPHDFEQTKCVADRDATNKLIGFECEFRCKRCGVNVAAFRSTYNVNLVYYPSYEIKKLRIKQDCDEELVNRVHDT